MKLTDLDTARKVWQQIDSIDADSVGPVSFEFVTPAELAKMFRAELKRRGLSNRQISVRYAKGDYCVSVEIPNISYEGIKGDEFWSIHDERVDAVNYLRELIGCMFPANGPRYGEGGIYSDAFYASYSVG